MLEVTGITNHKHYTGEDTWLDRYCEMGKLTRFPLSYHLLSGLFALTCAMGRRCRMDMQHFDLWPPISIMIIAESGTGKSQSLKIARSILRIMTDNLEDPFYLRHQADLTPSGMLEQWAKWQRDGQPGHNYPLEGAITCDEASTVLRATTGKENAAEFLINVLAHEDYTATTKSSGERTAHDITLGFGLTSTVSGMRESISASQFSGGFMHRFIIAHEMDKTKSDMTGAISQETKRDLALELIDIRENAPEEMEIEHETMQEYKALENKCEARTYPLACLGGFWNRMPAVTMKLAAARVLSDHRYTITPEDYRVSEELINNFIYSPLEELVSEMAAPPKLKTMFEISDNIRTCGPDGMDDYTFRKQIGPSWNYEKTCEYMESVELAYRGQTPETQGRWYRKKGWAHGFGVIEGTGTNDD